jgi:hypothetical protein
MRNPTEALIRALVVVESELFRHRGQQLRPMQNLGRIVPMLVPGDGLRFLDHRHVIIGPFPNGRRRLVDAARAMHLGCQEITHGYEIADLGSVPQGDEITERFIAPLLCPPSVRPPTGFRQDQRRANVLVVAVL